MEKINYEVSGKAPDSKSKPKKSRLLLFIAVIMLIAVSAGLLYYFTQDKVEGADETLAKVSNHILLPDNEKPTIAVVSNRQILLDQNSEAYANVNNGDILIIYSNRVIIYNPVDDVLVNVVPVLRTTEDTTTSEDPDISEESDDSDEQNNTEDSE